MRPFNDSTERINGPRISLQNLLWVDINETYASWLKDRDVNRFMAANLPTSMERLRGYFRKMTGSKDDMIFAIGLRKAGKHIGNATLQDIDRKKRIATFGIMIGDKNEWNKGYGREATTLVLRYGFSRLGLEKIVLGVHPYHAGAIKAYKKAGFTITKRSKSKIWMQVNDSRFKRGWKR